MTEAEEMYNNENNWKQYGECEVRQMNPKIDPRLALPDAGVKNFSG